MGMWRAGMRYSVRERGDAACRHGDPASERGTGTLRASRQACVGTLRASRDPVRACVHGPGVCVHVCVHGPGVCMHGDPSGTDWVCEDPVGMHTGMRGSSGHAHRHARIQWACTWVCGDPVGTHTGVQGSGKHDSIVLPCASNIQCVKK